LNLSLEHHASNQKEVMADMVKNINLVLNTQTIRDFALESAMNSKKGKQVIMFLANGMTQKRTPERLELASSYKIIWNSWFRKHNEATFNGK
jgi:hypothetical protein